MLINMPPPSCETMVPLPHVEYFSRKVSKVMVILEHGIEIHIGLLPQWTPRGVDIIRDRENLIEVVVGGDIQSSVTVTVTHDELIFLSGDINFVDGTNQLKTSQAAQWNRETRLKKEVWCESGESPHLNLLSTISESRASSLLGWTHQEDAKSRLEHGHHPKRVTTNTLCYGQNKRGTNE